MKRAKQVAVGILASLAFGLAALSAHAQPDAARTTEARMMGPGGHGQQGHAAGQKGRMGQGQQGAQGHMQHGAQGHEKHGETGAGPQASNCPMATQKTAQSTHSH